MSAQQQFIVGITGGSASGKTRFLNLLLSEFSPDQITLISQDNYYKPLAEQELDHNGEVNWDLPQSIDSRRFATDIHKLLNGQTLSFQEYTFNNTKNPVSRTVTLKPTKILVIEGIFAFHFQEIAKLMQLKIFVDAKAKIMYERRLARDVAERGMEPHEVAYQWDAQVMPAYKKFIKPYRKNSDLVIPNNTDCAKGLEVVVSYLKGKL
jgi:uridine kinase